MIPKWAQLLSEPNGWNIDIRPFNPLALVLLLVPLYFLRRRGKSAGYLVCFSLFFLYLWAVCAYAVCPLPIEASTVAWMRQTEHWSERLNWAPRILLRLPAYWNDEEFYGNILLGVPFGFGVPFVVAPKNATPRRTLAICAVFSVGLELVQLGISLIFYGFPYRSIDLEDAELVFAGTLLGYGALRAAAYAYRRIRWTVGASKPVWDHVHSVLFGVAGPRERRGEPGTSDSADTLSH